MRTSVNSVTSRSASTGIGPVTWLACVPICVDLQTKSENILGTLTLCLLIPSKFYTVIANTRFNSVPELSSRAKLQYKRSIVGTLKPGTHTQEYCER